MCRRPRLDRLRASEMVALLDSTPSPPSVLASPSVSTPSATSRQPGLREKWRMPTTMAWHPMFALMMTSAWWTRRSTIAAMAIGPPKIPAHAENVLLELTISERRS